MEDRLAYATNMVATSERHVLPKPIPLHRSQRSPSSEGRGGHYGRGNSTGRKARVMTITESRSADRKKVRKRGNGLRPRRSMFFCVFILLSSFL